MPREASICVDAIAKARADLSAENHVGALISGRCVGEFHLVIFL
jgi:hypothetical protein